MVWTLLFAASLVQGLFLVSIICLKPLKNVLASVMIVAMLIIMMLTNLGYVAVHTELRDTLPELFAVPFGMMFLFGPLFLFYARSITDPSFRWKNWYWIHFIPYLVQVLLNWPLWVANKQVYAWYISSFLSETLAIRPAEKITYACQIIQLSAYLVLTLRFVRKANSAVKSSELNVPINARMTWLRSLAFALGVFLLTVLVGYVVTLLSGTYHPVLNYAHTLAASAIIYFLAYQFMLQPELIGPGFSMRYKGGSQLTNGNEAKYLLKLTELMNVKKVFLDPELKLPSVAHSVGLTPHQLSRLINEKLGKSFSDYVNEFRVQAFLQNIENPKFERYTIYGMALDVGFNSKSSFNLAFKKITGKTPSQFKSSQSR